MTFPETPDGRYFVVRGRLWRTSNPHLDSAERERLVHELMSARRAVRSMRADAEAVAHARARVDAAKTALGERGPVWWTDGAPDFNRKFAVNTPYAGWFAALGTPTRGESSPAVVPHETVRNATEPSGRSLNES